MAINPVYPTQIIHEVYIGSSWVDLTHDVIGSQSCNFGISGNGPLDRIASTGNLKIILRNDAGCIGGKDGYYSPNRVGSLPGWDKGLNIRQKFIYGGITYIKYYGHIVNIQLGSGFNKIVTVDVADWMDYAATHPIFSPTMIFDKRMNEVVSAVLALMPIQPLETNLQVGADIFPTVFDTVRAQTKALTEFSKVALSELGYLYLRRGTTGEKLISEGRHVRQGGDVVSIPTGMLVYNIALEDGSGDLLLEDGSYLLSYAMNYYDAIFDNSMMAADVGYGSHLFNRISVKSYPRLVDIAATTVLFSLSSPTSLAAGETKTDLRGTFRDPVGGASKVAGMNMVTPVATTDYQMFANRDGTGTNLTANLIVTAVYGASDVLYTLHNTGGTPGYVTKLQARGKGIYIYDPIEYVNEDTASKNEYGYLELSVDMKYQQNTETAAALADVMLSQLKDPKISLNKITYLANYSDFAMMMFFTLDIGDLINIKESLNGVNANYYIQALDYKITPGKIIKCIYTVAEASSLSSNYWQLEMIGFSELGTTTVLGY